MKRRFSLSLVLFTIGLLGETTPLSAELCAIDYEGGGTYVPGGPPGHLVPIDLDDDGDTDLATITNTPTMVVLLFNDGEGRDELVVISARTSTVTVLVTGPDGTLREDAVYAVEEMPVDLAIGDMNNDGSPDVVASTFLSEGTGFCIFLAECPSSPSCR